LTNCGKVAEKEHIRSQMVFFSEYEYMSKPKDPKPSNPPQPSKRKKTYDEFSEKRSRTCQVIIHKKANTLDESSKVKKGGDDPGPSLKKDSD
jgi:hypothetical protein